MNVKAWTCKAWNWRVLLSQGRFRLAVLVIAVIGFAVFGFAVLATPAAAQIPPPLPSPQVPTPNPSSSLVVPQAPEAPVSPAAPRSSPDFPGVARVPNDASVLGSDSIMAPEPRWHRAAQHRRQHLRRRANAAR
jgi:hypothetical protein